MNLPDENTIYALGSLNSMARCHDAMTPRLVRSIYYYKLQLLECLLEAGLLALRPIKAQVKCSACGGTGWWSENRRCYRCTKGIAELEFVEARLENGLVFHSPAHKAGKLYRSVNWEETVYVQGSEWKPNQPGQELSPAQAAECLNAVETWRYGETFPSAFVIPRGNRFGYQDAWDSDQNYFYYKLYLGSWKSGDCRYCGSFVKDAFCHSTPLVWWLDSRCAACEVRHHFDANEPPPELVIDASVQKWLERRAAWQMAEPLAQTLNAW